MDSKAAQLHPNWRALATIHLPLKRFVPEGAEENVKGRLKNKGKQPIEGITGEEASQFYQEILGTEKTSNFLLRKQLKPHSEIIVKQRTVPFDKNLFFRYATTNKGQELFKFEMTENEINTCDIYGWSALMMAACEGAESAVKALLELGADKGLRDKSGKTALLLAKNKRHWSIVDLLAQEYNVKTGEIVSQETKAKLTIEPYYCATCKRTFSETTERAHITSTVHQFNSKSTLPANKLQKFNIPGKNRGLKIMVKQGWDKERGLGPTQTGRLYPVKTVIRKQRTGLGIEQAPARVTHFEAYDLRATAHRSSDYYCEKKRDHNDMRREKHHKWQLERRLRNELS